MQILQTVWTTRFCCVAGWMLNLSAFLGGFPCCSDAISPQIALDLLFKALIFLGYQLGAWVCFIQRSDAAIVLTAWRTQIVVFFFERFTYFSLARPKNQML